MNIFRLTAADYEEMLELMRVVFTRQNGKDTNFKYDLPKMCIPDDEHTGHHLGIREDGKLVAVIGIYPLPVKVGEENLLFTTVGNVVTHWDYEGRGYMQALLTAAMKELERIEADGSRLCGLRGRYNRFGYEACGAVYEMTLTADNVKRRFSENNLTFTPISAEDTDALAFTWQLYSQNGIAVDRTEQPNFRDVYASLTAWRNRPFLAMDGDTPVGYFSADSDGDWAEWGAVDAKTAGAMAAAWQRKQGRSLLLRCAPHQVEAIRIFSRACEQLKITSPSHFKICRWDRVLDAFLKLKQKISPLPEGKMTVAIGGYGAVRITVQNGVASCVNTDAYPEMTMDPLTASRFFFGPLPSVCTGYTPPVANAWFPLPLTWNLQDRV